MKPPLGGFSSGNVSVSPLDVCANAIVVVILRIEIPPSGNRKHPEIVLGTAYHSNRDDILFYTRGISPQFSEFHFSISADLPLSHIKCYGR